MMTHKTTTHEPIVEELKALLKENHIMAEVLPLSLKAARQKAKDNLDTDLYHAIDNEFNGTGWPTNLDEYYTYLDQFVRMIPNELDDPEYPDAWKSNDQQNGYNQKVYDLLCQFYFLVDQGADGKSMQSFTLFADWLVKFAREWGSFLDTESSLTEETLQSFIDDPMYNMDWYIGNRKSWHTFNTFFYREFNDSDPKTGKSPLRPIADPDNNSTIVAPADCTYKMQYGIDNEGNVVHTDGLNAEVVLKHTHTIGNINDLLNESQYASDFYGGTFVHYFLSPFDYHRFHTAVGGEVLEIKDIPGKVYLNVDITDKQFDAPDGATDGYEFVQARGLIIIDAGAEVGKVAILPIGMCQVSGVMMYNGENGNPSLPKTVVKGQEFGKFKFGGSDIIMLFQKNPDLYLFKNDPSHNPIHFQYGQTAAYWNLKNH